MEAWWTANVLQPFEQFMDSYNTSSNRQSADAVQKRIKLARTTGLCNLERNLNWKHFPDFIFDVVGANKCKVIDVSENQIEEIPNKVNLLQKCTKLIVANNLLLRLPKNGLHMPPLRACKNSRLGVPRYKGCQPDFVLLGVSFFAKPGPGGLAAVQLLSSLAPVFFC